VAFKFGTRSRREMKGVHPSLIKVVFKALELTRVDFSVIDGVRTKIEQERMVQRGLSQTMNSKHLVQKDGHGHAIDVVPYFNGKIRWEWPLIFDMAEAFFLAAEFHDVTLTWGGAWTEKHEEFEHSINPDFYPTAEFMQLRYIKRRQKEGKKLFLDGPHFQLR
jgi:peptidoglycan L-alanyl-D-glutamate endopeptidase CwlK